MTVPDGKPEWKVIIDLLREVNPLLLNRMGRKMMNYLIKRNVQQVEELLGRLHNAGETYEPSQQLNPNVPVPRINFALLEEVVEECFKIAGEVLNPDELSNMVSLWLRHEQSRFLTMAAERRDIPLNDIAEAVHRFSIMPDSQRSLSPEENTAVRVALTRRFLSEDMNFINTIKQHVTVPDFASLLSRTIGPSRGNGKLGGKAAGLYRADRILHAAKQDNIILRNVTIPKTWFLASDGMLDFFHFNAIEEMVSIKYRDTSEIRQEYPYLQQVFKNSFLPPEIISGLNMALDDFNDKPLILRSSSLLEDSQGSAFAGKYKSLFVANQGTRRERLAALVDAILEIYASVFGPDPIEYRRERGLLDFNEEMGILIQEVVGRRFGKYFFPAFAGVAFSRNEFRWSPRIRKTDGIIRLVAGTGTRAVDRVGDDYPVLISPGQPGLRVNATPEDMLWYCQKNIDVINLESRRLETMPFDALLAECGRDYPALPQVVSIYREGQMMPSIGTMVDLKAGQPVITFSNLIERSPFIALMKSIMSVLEEKLGYPVDVEFASDGDLHKLYVLQCRPQSMAGGAADVTVPAGIPHDDQLFTANRHITTGVLKDIEYIVYVDPINYDSLGSMEELVQVGRAIGELNSKLPHQKFILMGPGRWGSRGDIKLGVKVTYSDINNSAMLIEIARNKKGYVPELSFGTHFFQDLVEANIRYLPLYPDEPGNLFNEAFLKNSPNMLRRLVPSARKLEDTVTVIHVPRETNGATVSVVMDGNHDAALAYLQR